MCYVKRCCRPCSPLIVFVIMIVFFKEWKFTLGALGSHTTCQYMFRGCVELL